VLPLAPPARAGVVDFCVAFLVELLLWFMRISFH
jgi:hypothetical protein